MGTSGTPLKYVILFYFDLYGCVRLMNQIYLTLTTFENTAQINLIDLPCVFLCILTFLF